MNLALYDADLFARAVRDSVHEHDDTALRTYSERCLRRVWNDQEFSHWMTRMLHDAGDATHSGPSPRTGPRATRPTLHVRHRGPRPSPNS